jgi:phage recombination protein Bet
MTMIEHENGNSSQLVMRQTVMGAMADRYHMEPTKLLQTIKATCIKGNATNEQVQAFLIVANRYGLDPFLKEIHAFAGQGGGIVPIVGIDGWSRIANSTGKLDGCEFEFSGVDEGLACTCTIHVKDRTHPVRVTEYMAECGRSTQPWKQYPRRMLRHKAFMQCARLAFGLGGIYDEDEARDVIGNETVPAPTITSGAPRSRQLAQQFNEAKPVVTPEEEAAANAVIEAKAAQARHEQQDAPPEEEAIEQGDETPAVAATPPVNSTQVRKDALYEVLKVRGLHVSERSAGWNRAMVAIGKKGKEEDITDEQWTQLLDDAESGAKWFVKVKP